MSKYIVDTDLGTVEPYTKGYEGNTIADYMLMDLGAKEWDETVRKIQKWFYGSFIKAAWCATAVSYYAYRAGKKVVGRFENVDSMKDHMNNQGLLDCTKNYGGGNYTPKKGDLVFMSSRYTYSDCTHVGVLFNLTGNTATIISGNSSNMIQLDTYNIDNPYIVAWGRVD